MDAVTVFKDIKRGLFSPVYLLQGEEDYLRDELLVAFKEALVSPEIGDFNFDLIDGQHISIEDIINLANTIPFMAERRLLVIKNTDVFKSKKKKAAEEDEDDSGAKIGTDEAVLLNYLANPALTSCLVFTTREPADRRKKTYKALQQYGKVIDLSPLKGEELIRWINNQASQWQKTFESSAVDQLVELVGHNMLRLSNEIQKLSLYVQDGNSITTRDVTLLVAKNIESNIFDMVDAVGERRVEDALLMLHEVLFSGEPPVKVNLMIARQFRMLAQVKSLVNDGQSETRIGQILGLKGFILKKYLKQCRSFKLTELQQAMQYLLDVDKGLKSSRQKPQHLIEQALVRICASNI